MAPLFAGPLSATRRAQSLRAAQQSRNKRKRDGDEESESDAGPPGGVTSTSQGSVLATLTAADAYQYRVAGHSPEDELPARPFPHAPASSSKAQVASSELQKELASLKPALYAPGVSATARLPHASGQVAQKLHARHLGALTTALHVCLLKGDYQRAGRAWGMILRTKSQGGVVDVRHGGRWGIAAELLLHKQSSSGQHSPAPSDRSARSESLESAEDSAGRIHDSTFTEEGFNAAREYYRRLILQHPYHKSHPKAVNAVTFYPVMFSLWVFEVCENTKRARIGLSARLRRDASASESDSELASGSEKDSVNEARKEGEKAIRESELKHAEEIAARLDQLLVTPPFDRNPGLLHLRGMLALWVGDLLAQDKPDAGKTSPDTNEDAPGQDNTTRENEILARQEQIQKAKELFRKTERSGGRVWHGVTYLLTNDDEDQDVDAAP